MGTKSSATDEWLELYNYGSQEVSLSGWHLAAADGSPNIALSGSIAPAGYYLIERTDDTTVSDTPANLVASFGHGLGNDGEDLSLIDGAGNIQDEVNAAGGWFAGDNTAKTSMERVNPGVSGSVASNWASNNGAVINGLDSAGNRIMGTPGVRNSVAGGS